MDGQPVDTMGVRGRSSRSGEGKRYFQLHVCRAMLVSACSSGHKPIWLQQLMWHLPALVAHSFPGCFLCPGAEKAIGVSLFKAYQYVWAERSRQVFMLLPSEDASQSIWYYRCVWMQISRNLGIAQAENQVRSYSGTAPAAVPRKSVLIWQFYWVLLFSAL